MENHARSILKTITWRIVATLTTALLVFIFTENFFISLGVGFLEFMLKTPVYYLHERIWNMLQYGRINPQDNNKNVILHDEKLPRDARIS